MKKVIAFLLLVFQIANFCFAKSKTNKIEIRYLMWDWREKSYAVYENEERISTLSMLNGRKIFGIKFDKANPDFILFAEQNENVYSVKQIDFITNEETTLFSFEYPMYNTLEEVHCDFKKRYEGQGGRLILLSDNYLLVPLAIKPFRDSIKNGLFLSIWTVCYTVFDISKNRRVFAGLVTRTNELKIIDAILMDSADKTKL